MSADWARLRQSLARQGDEVTLSWAELDELVGGVPTSALRHAAWWGGDRPHSRAWRQAGFALSHKTPGVSVTFRRVGHGAVAPERGPGSLAPASQLSETGLPGEPEGPPSVGAAVGVAPEREVGDVVLLSCGKQKLARPAAARDLYTSTTFVKARRYAEQAGRPWFILSAEHGLVRPDDWVAPYERYLPDTPTDYRAAWGEWVAARLGLLHGSLDGLRCEIHAGRTYVDAVADCLRRRGAEVVEPLRGLAQGGRLAWYDQAFEVHAGRGAQTESDPSTGSTGSPDQGAGTPADLDAWVRLLTDVDLAITPSELLASRRAELDQPGLYSWWVDVAGAEHLTAGLGQALRPGLIYAGLAGATRWPSGRASGNTLWTRLVGMHLGKKARFSTFRLTLGSILMEQRGWHGIEEAELTEWMHEHLRVLAVPQDDADTLGELERGVLRRLDPPLNLQGMPPSDIRVGLKRLRQKARGA